MKLLECIGEMRVLFKGCVPIVFKWKYEILCGLPKLGTYILIYKFQSIQEKNITNKKAKCLT